MTHKTAHLDRDFWSHLHTCVCARHSVMPDSATPQTVACKAPLSMDFPDKNTGVGCHLLLQGIFPTQGSKVCLSPALAGRIFYHCATRVEPLEHIQKPRSYGMILRYLVKLKIQTLWLSSSTDTHPWETHAHRQSHARINMKASFSKQTLKTTCMPFTLQIFKHSNLHKWAISNVSTWKTLKVLKMSAKCSLHNSSNILNQQCCSLFLYKV